MVRKGWIRGPRPKSEQWPRQSGRSTSAASPPWLLSGQRTARSSVEARQGPDQSGCETQPCSGSRGHVRGSAGQGAETGSSALRNGRLPRPRSQCFASSSITRQSRHGPTSVGRASRSVPTVERTVKRIEELDRAREAESGLLQEGRQRLHRLQQEAAAGAQTVSNRPALPDVASEDQVARRQAVEGLQMGSMPQWFAQTTVYGRVRRRKVESNPKISCVRQWKSSFGGARWQKEPHS